MNQGKGPLMVLSFLVIAALMMSVYFTYQPSTTEIIYYPENYEDDGGTSSKKPNSSSSKTESSKKTSSSKTATSQTTSSKRTTSSRTASSKTASSKSTASKPVTHESTEQNDTVTSWIDDETSEELFSSFEDFSEPSQIPFESSGIESADSSALASDSSSWVPSVSDSDSSMPDDSQPPDTEARFEKVRERADELQEVYGITIWLNLATDIIDEAYGIFEQPDEAMQMLEELDSVLAALDWTIPDALTERGYPLELMLVRSHPLGEASQSYLAEDTAQLILSYQPESILAKTYYELMHLADTLMADDGVLDLAVKPFEQVNPEDFVYGIFAPNYLNSNWTETYFYNIASQGSVGEDRALLYAHYYTKELDDALIDMSCPISQKLQAIWQSLELYLRPAEQTVPA